MLLNIIFFVNISGYSWILKNHAGNEYLHEYGDVYEVNIYPMNRIRGNYYPNHIYCVDTLMQ